MALRDDRDLVGKSANQAKSTARAVVTTRATNGHLMCSRNRHGL